MQMLYQAQSTNEVCLFENKFSNVAFGSLEHMVYYAPIRQPHKFSSKEICECQSR